MDNKTVNHPDSMAAPATDNNPLKMSCKACGAPLGFDIVEQTYACKHCGEKAKLPASAEKWTELSEIKPSSEGQTVEEHHCPSCGAHVIFGHGEASVTCDFCGGNLVRKDFAEGGRLPSVILPFVITRGEAKDQLLRWADNNKNKPEGKFVLKNIGRLKAYYLPYELVRGPVSGYVKRHGTSRKYRCRGYLEGTAVNTSKQLNNLILNLAEPFDWSKALPFDYGYVAGQNVKLSDISASDVKKRISAEVNADFLPQVEKIMQTTGVDLHVNIGNMLAMPVLVPMYFLCEGKLTAVVNGQTGRVAVSAQRVTKTFPWVIEPLLYTVLATFFLNLPFMFDLELLLLSGTVFALIFFAAMSEGRNSLIRNVIFRSRTSKAERIGKELYIAEGRDILKNPYDNTPVFIEKNEQEKDVSVKIRFYSFGRLSGVFLRMLIMMGLPVFIAGMIRLAMIWGTDEPFMKYFKMQYGAAWFVLFGFICLIYWIRGVRHDVYEHPLLYEITDDGKTRLMGSRASRRVGLLSMFGVGKAKKDGTIVSFFGRIREMGGFGIFLICFIAFLLFGCVGAILL